MSEMKGFLHIGCDTAKILNHLGFEYTPNGYLNEDWLEVLSCSKLVSKIEVEGKTCSISFIDNALLYGPVEYSENIHCSYPYGLGQIDAVVNITYIPLFDQMRTVTKTRGEWPRDIESPIFTGESLSKYSSLLKLAFAHRDHIINTWKGGLSHGGRN